MRIGASRRWIVVALTTALAGCANTKPAATAATEPVSGEPTSRVPTPEADAAEAAVLAPPPEVAPEPALPLTPSPVKLPHVGLTVDVVGPPKVEKAPLDGGDSVEAANTDFVVSRVDAAHTQREIEKGANAFAPATNLATEKLKDGWVMTWEVRLGEGTTYWVEAHRTVAGKAYGCGTFSPTAAERDAAVAACKSLRP